MKAYLKGAYGYKNFGDEILLFGVINRIFQNYKIQELVIEVGEINWINKRIELNKKFEFVSKNLSKVQFVGIKQHKYKIITHVLNLLGFGKYKNYFKFFGGGQVFDDQRSFPHDGRNIFILYNYSIRKGNFVLLGGINNIHKFRTKILYNFVLPKAQKIVVREKNSYEITKKILQNSKKNVQESLILHKDFSYEILENFYQEIASLRSQEKNILINLSSHSFKSDPYQKIQEFCEKFDSYQKTYFYCDWYDDKNYYENLSKKIKNLKFYDWTKKDILQTLELFWNCCAGIGARLHFLYPLKIFQKKIVCLSDSDKIKNLISRD